MDKEHSEIQQAIDNETPVEQKACILFHGIRHSTSNCEVNYIKNDNAWRSLSLYTQVVNHSPTGFNWGYMGSGPAQLALALLYKTIETFYPEAKEKRIGRVADRYHRPMKFELLPLYANSTDWYLDGSTILDWLKEKAPDFEKELFEQD